MHGNPNISVATLHAFLLVLARVSGVFVFVPLPGVRTGPEPIRAVLTLSFTVALFPLWPTIYPAEVSMGRMTGWLLSEAALGITIGLAVAFATEAFVLAAQMIGLQAGYAYASTVDPTTQADSSVLLVLAQLCAGLLFIAFGLDREIIRIFGRSLETRPPGAFLLSPSVAHAALRAGASMFSTGFRLALPALALLLSVDLGLALLGRLNMHLQLLTLAFPVKMLAALGLLAWIAVLLPTVFRGTALEMLGSMRVAVGY